MLSELRGLMKRQYNNFRIFKAYSASTLIKESIMFPRDLLSATGRSSNILNIALFVTVRCNAKCAMCNLTGILNKNGLPDMPAEKMERFLDGVKRYHPGIILFGGEPFVRKDLIKLVTMVKARDLTAGVFTNGTLLNEDLAGKVIREKLDWIAFSLQGTKEVHDRILGFRGAFDTMVQNIRLFTKKRPRTTKVIIHSTICEHNINDLKNLARFGIDLGADLVRFGHPTFYSEPESVACTNSLRRLLDDSQARAMSYIYDIRGKTGLYIKNILDLKAELGGKVAFSPDLGEEELMAWYSPDFRSKRRCLFAWRGAFIYPNGDMYPCESISYKVGNVFDDGFEEVWNGFRYKKFRQILKKGLFPACARCCKL